MKIKPKEIMVNLPIVLQFTDYHELPEFAANINQIIHGKVKIKYEELGVLGGQYIGIFYLQRNDEFTELRKEFKTMIEQEEMNRVLPLNGKESSCLALLAQNPNCDNVDSILNSLQGFALEVAKTIIGKNDNASLDVKIAAQAMIDWAKGIKHEY